MKNLNSLLKIVLALALVAFVACDRTNVTEPQAPTQDRGIFELPGVTLDSAVFRIYVGIASGQTVNVHRITAPWVENTVTFNSFAGAYDPAVVASFVTDAPGWESVDITPLVQGWIDGVFPNYGILIEQGATNASVYASSEYINASLHPMLTIGFTTSGGSQAVTMKEGFNGTVPDAYISQLYPTDNYGAQDRLFTGIIYGSFKQSLLYFDMPTFPELGSIGDYVWCDDNGDGLQDMAELGIEGVTVNLMDCAGTILDTDVTNSSGLYLFDELQPGNYKIQFVLPAGYQFSLPNQGNDAIDSDADVTTGITDCTSLDEGETDLTWDAGMICPTPDSGCTRTIGYWKTHAGFGPQRDVVTPLLPIWLGTPAGTKSINVTTATIAYNILSQDVYGTPENGITKLYAQLLGAKLNGEAGAELTDVAAIIAAADAFLANNDWNDWEGLSDSDRDMVLGWHDMLDDYNNGLIGPIHCE